MQDPNSDLTRAEDKYPVRCNVQKLTFEGRRISEDKP